jgi:hypothetical protein
MTLHKEADAVQHYAADRCVWATYHS